MKRMNSDGTALRPVPVAAIGLPWIRFPRDSATCTSIVDTCTAHLARPALTVAEREFWTSLSAHVSAVGALASTESAQRALPRSVPRTPREGAGRLKLAGTTLTLILAFMSPRIGTAPTSVTIDASSMGPFPSLGAVSAVAPLIKTYAPLA